jgi:tetratricopeptide (TPR) repeat protein
MLNREDEAIRSYDNAIEVNPELPSPFLYKAALLSRLERFEEAQKFYNAALSKVPVQKSEETAVAS